MNKKSIYQISNHHATPLDVVQFFWENMELLASQKNRVRDKLYNKVTKKLFDPNVTSHAFVEKLLLRCQEHYRQHIFSPQNLLKLMDQNGGQLSMAAIELLRTLETDTKYSRQTIFPSKSMIGRVASLVDLLAAKLVPFIEGITDKGEEYFEFEVAPVILIMLKAFGLEEASKKRSVLINQAIDGACITNNLHHTTYGVKMADILARDPKTKQLIYGNTNKTCLQSKHYCFPLKMILARESKEVISKFENIMKELKNLTCSEGAKKWLNGAKPIRSLLNADMSAFWKILERGHGVKKGTGNLVISVQLMMTKHIYITMPLTVNVGVMFYMKMIKSGNVFIRNFWIRKMSNN